MKNFAVRTTEGLEYIISAATMSAASIGTASDAGVAFYDGAGNLLAVFPFSRIVVAGEQNSISKADD